MKCLVHFQNGSLTCLTLVAITSFAKNVEKYISFQEWSICQCAYIRKWGYPKPAKQKEKPMKLLMKPLAVGVLPFLDIIWTVDSSGISSPSLGPGWGLERNNDIRGWSLGIPVVFFPIRLLTTVKSIVGNPLVTSWVLFVLPSVFKTHKSG